MATFRNVTPFIAKYLTPGNVQRMKLVHKKARNNMNTTVNVNKIRNNAIAAKKKKNNAIRQKRVYNRMFRGRETLNAHRALRIMMKKLNA